MAGILYNVPDPFPQGGPPQAQELRRNFHHVLPQQIDPNTTFEGPHSSIPNHQPLLRACWGRSAFRRSQGNPALSLSGPYPQPVLHTPPTLTSTTSTRPTTSDPTSRRQWLAQSPVPPTSSRSSPTQIRLKGRAEKTTFAFSRVPTFCFELSCLLFSSDAASALMIFLFSLSRYSFDSQGFPTS